MQADCRESITGFPFLAGPQQCQVTGLEQKVVKGMLDCCCYGSVCFVLLTLSLQLLEVPTNILGYKYTRITMFKWKFWLGIPVTVPIVYSIYLKMKWKLSTVKQIWMKAFISFSKSYHSCIISICALWSLDIFSMRYRTLQ